MKKTLLVFAGLLFFFNLSLPLRAQRFEWAKGYSSQQESNYIKGSVTDSEGNLYILGSFRNDAVWNGEFLLLPMAPYGYACDNVNTIIAKISPEGEMLWRKVLHSNNGQVNYPQDIKKVGDSAFACMMVMALPCDANYTYYLDTLIPDVSDYPISSRYMGYALCNAFVVFDFEGNVKEQHFLQITYTDYNGDDIVYHVTHPFDPIPWYLNTYFKWEQVSFDIDGEGNIYISRCADDWTAHGEERYDVQNGTIRGIKFWVDRRLAGYYPITGDYPMKWYPQIVKFAPHFDTLLACRYVIQGMSDSMEYYVNNTMTKVDNNGNVYHMCDLRQVGYYYGNNLDYSVDHSNTLILDSILGIEMYHADFNNDISYVVKLTPNLEPIYLLYLKDSIVGSSRPSSSRPFFYDIDFDEDSSRGFISGFVQKNQNATSVYALGDSVLNITHNDAFVVSFDMESGDYKSCAVVPSLQSSNIGLRDDRNNLSVRHNRIFLQCQYYGGIDLPTQTIHTPGNAPGLCLVMFDYSGNVITGKPYNTTNPDSRPGSISLQDSTLYLTNLLVGDAATFGDIHVPAQGYYACIAKYVDTAFMTPYVNSGDTGNVSIVMSGNDDAFVVYPNPFRHRVTVRYDGGEELTAAYVTGLDGRSEQVKLQREGTGRYTIDLTARPQSTCLLTLVTASGRQHTLELLKQSDMFGDQ